MARLNILALIIITSPCFAELRSLNDEGLSHVTGEGLGVVLEDFVFNVDDAVTTLTGIENSNGEDITVKWTDLYIMGEGSNKGTVETPVDIGTLAHPWTITALPGSDISSVNDSISVLQVAAENYTDVLNNTEDYATWAFYQDKHCRSTNQCGSNPNNAVTAIDALITDMNNQRTSISGRYSNDITGLNSSVTNDLNNQIKPQQQVVANEQADVQPAYNSMQFYWDRLGSGARNDTDGFGTPSDGICTIFEDCSYKSEYNNAVSNYRTQVNQFNDAQRELARRWNEVKWRNVSLKERLTDLEQYESLCGDVGSTGAGCADGAIVIRQAQRSKVADVAVGIGSGLTRRGGIDIGSKFEFDVFDSTTNSTRKDFFDIDLSGVTLDGSYIRLWGNGGDLDGEINLKMFADSLSIATCGTGCNAAQVQASTLTGTNVFINLALGYGKAQPLKFNVTPDGQFEAELPKLKYNVDPNGDGHINYYQNAPKTSISIGNINLGGNTDLGGLTVDGLQFNYLKVSSHDL